MIQTKAYDVALYLSGCVVKRKGIAHLEAGSQKVSIAGLTRSCEPTTVRLSLPSGIAGSNVQVESLTADQKKEALKELETGISLLKKKITAKEKQLEMWNVNADFSGKNAVDVNEMADYIEKLPDRMEKIGRELESLNDVLAKLNKQLKDKKTELDRNFVTADVNVPQEGDYPVEIRYFERNASWCPTYEIHCENEEEGLLLRLRAKVRQGTGEDWDQIALSLFTGNPSTSGTIPALPKETVSLTAPRRMMKNSFAGGAAPMMSMARMEDTVEFEAVAEEADYGMEEVVYDQAVVNKGDAMIEYTLNGTMDVVKDRDVLLDISSRTVNCQYHTVCVPKIDQSAYLAAEVSTRDIEDLLETEATVYYKGTYMGNVYLNPDATKDKYDLSLGSDETVKVRRKEVRKYTSTVLLKGQKKTEYEYEIRITSAKPKPCKVTVLDQIPVSADKSIVIEPRQLSDGKLNKDSGEVRWDLELEPAETKVMALNYDIAWPKDKNLYF